MRSVFFMLFFGCAAIRGGIDGGHYDPFLKSAF